MAKGFDNLSLKEKVEALLAMAETPVTKESVIAQLGPETDDETEIKVGEILSRHAWQIPGDDKEMFDTSVEIARWQIERNQEILDWEEEKGELVLADQIRDEWRKRRQGFRGMSDELFWMEPPQKREVISQLREKGIKPSTVENQMMQPWLFEGEGPMSHLGSPFSKE